MTVPANTANAPARRGWLHALPALAVLAVFVIALVALHRMAGEIHLRDVLASAANLQPMMLAGALALAAASYGVLTLYDVLALRHVGQRLPYPQVALTSFVAWALGHNVGVVAFSAGAIRLRMYSLAGLNAAQIATIIAFTALTFQLGAALLLGISLIAEAGRAASLLHAAPLVSIVLGAAILIVLGGYIVVTAVRREPVSLGGWRFSLPTWRITLAQVAVAAADLALAGAALYLLLPADPGVPLFAFLGLYMVAMVAGALSAVPAGLGVFESVLLLLLPGADRPGMLGGLLLYRLVYYALPFVLALLVLSASELRHHGQRVRRAWHWARRSLDFVVPQAIAMLAFAAGTILLVSGATPAVEELSLIHI